MGTGLKLRCMALIRVTKIQNNEMSGRRAHGGPRRDRGKQKHYSSVCGLMANSSTFQKLYEYTMMYACILQIYTFREIECEFVKLCLEFVH